MPSTRNGMWTEATVKEKRPAVFHPFKKHKVSQNPDQKDFYEHIPKKRSVSDGL